MPLDDRRNKKMLVFSSPLNPIWTVFLANDGVSQTAINKMMGISSTALSNWKRGSAVGDATTRRIFAKLLETVDNLTLPADAKRLLTETLGNFHIAYLDNSKHLFEAAITLSMDAEKCRIVMDSILYEQRPIFYEMYYDANNRDMVRRGGNHLSMYKGGYYAWVARGGLWLRFPLHVRYTIRIGDGLLIRCKLNIPKKLQQSGDIHFYKYDGFMVRRPHKIFWMFEKRDSDLNDYFYIITGIGRRAGKILSLGGTYLTTDQDEEQSVVTGDILIRSLDLEDPPEIDKMMRDDAAVMEDKEMDELLNTLRDRYGKTF